MLPTKARENILHYHSIAVINNTALWFDTNSNVTLISFKWCVTYKRLYNKLESLDLDLKVIAHTKIYARICRFRDMNDINERY